MKLAEYITAHVGLTSRNNAYKRATLSLLALLNEFDNELLTSSFSEKTSWEFVTFLRNHRKKYRPNTISRRYQQLVTILNSINNIGRDYRIHVTGELPHAIYLTPCELAKLKELKEMPPAAHIMRDYFLVMCYTGLRYSDIKQLTPYNIKGNRLTVRQQKTKQAVELPIHPNIADILHSWRGGFPYLSSPQMMRVWLQKICKKAGISSIVTIECTRGNKITRKKYRKYELVTPHTGRRTFATNLYLSSQAVDTPLARIMLLTGHRTEQAFFKYIRIEKSENADVMARHPFFTPNFK